MPDVPALPVIVPEHKACPFENVITSVAPLTFIHSGWIPAAKHGMLTHTVIIAAITADKMRFFINNFLQNIWGVSLGFEALYIIIVLSPPNHYTISEKNKKTRRPRFAKVRKAIPRFADFGFPKR
jgi:hypothetical protein